MKKFLFVLIVLFTFIIQPVFAEISTNTGFLSNQIWYSKDSFVEGDTVNIYTAIWNGNSTSLSAKVEFYDKNIVLGFRDIIIKSKTLKDVYISWKVSSGEHVISAKITSSTINSTSGKKETIVLKSNKTKTDRRFIPTVIKTKDGKLATNNEILIDQIKKVTKNIDKIIPTKISEPIIKNINSLDNFRNKTLNTILENKIKTKNEVLFYNNKTSKEKSISINKDNNKNNEVKSIEINKNNEVKNIKNIQDVTKKPIAQVKLFFLTILAYIFSHKIIFYGLLIFIIYYIIRSVYRKIINR